MRTSVFWTAALWATACSLDDLGSREWDDSGATIRFPSGWRAQPKVSTYALLSCDDKNRCVGLFPGEPRGNTVELDPAVYADMESTNVAANITSCPVQATPVRKVDVEGADGAWLRELAVCSADGDQIISYGLVRTPSHIHKFMAFSPGHKLDQGKAFTGAVVGWMRFPTEAAAVAPVRLEPSKQSLTEARTAHPHKTTRTPSRELFTGAEAPVPPAGSGLERVHIEGPAGPLVAYQTPYPGDGQPLPVVVWAHGGAGGIGAEFWTPASAENDQSASAFREAGIALVIPSWRGENDNPGEPEFLRGEVDDLLAARDHAAALPWTDPTRVYVMGHSTGGTLAALLAGVSDQQRAVVAIGANLLPDALWSEASPVDPTSNIELDLRSPAIYAPFIATPTVLIEGHFGNPLQPMQEMQRINPDHITAVPVARANHFDLLAPVTAMLARQILADDPSQPFTVDPSAVQAAVDEAWGSSETWPLGR